MCLAGKEAPASHSLARVKLHGQASPGFYAAASTQVRTIINLHLDMHL